MLSHTFALKWPILEGVCVLAEIKSAPFGTLCQKNVFAAHVRVVGAESVLINCWIS